jgi:hypothetical protein
MVSSGDNTMKVLLLARYDRQGASSRLRTMQYLPYLADAGLEVRVESLFDANYLEGTSIFDSFCGHAAPQVA